MGIGSVGLGFLAGVLSVLSPCVLPLLPLVFTAALAEHRFGMLALALGLAVSFVTIGLFAATIGFSLGLDADAFRMISAVLLAGVGVVLLSEALQLRFALVFSAGGSRLTGWSPSGLRGQFVLGLMLGAVWTPCVGPTLGAASLLAAQRSEIIGVASVMLAFGIGAALPLLAIATVSRETLGRWRGRIAQAGKLGKQLLGSAMLAIAILVLSGADHVVETALVTWSPDWLTDVTTRF
jgi:cytochrome c biogenesis protein CcdA